MWLDLHCKKSTLALLGTWLWGDQSAREGPSQEGLEVMRQRRHRGCLDQGRGGEDTESSREAF